MFCTVNNLSYYDQTEEFILADKIKTTVNKNLDNFANKLAKKTLERNDFLSLSEELTKIRVELIGPTFKEAMKKHPNEKPILVSAYDGAFEPTRVEESTRKGSRGKGE